MKIVVIGGTGLIGSKVVSLLREGGHEAIPASPRLGINTLTGEGLAEALDGASVVVDVSNSPNFEPAAVLEFFQTSTRNLLAAEATAGVGHHVALSIVGIDRSPDNGYFQAKIAQEDLITAGPQSPVQFARAVLERLGLASGRTLDAYESVFHAGASVLRFLKNLILLKPGPLAPTRAISSATTVL